MTEDMDFTPEAAGEEAAQFGPAEERAFELGFNDDSRQEVKPSAREGGPARVPAEGWEDGAGPSGEDDEETGGPGGAEGWREGAEESKKAAGQDEPLKVFFLGREVEVKAEDITNLVQKGLNHDRLASRLAERKEGEKLVQEMAALSSSLGIGPEELVRQTVGLYREKELQRLTQSGLSSEQAGEIWEQKLAAARADQPKPNGGERDLKAEIAGLFEDRPYLQGIRSFPPPVARDINSGMEVKAAYNKYEKEQAEASVRKLVAQNRELQDKLLTHEQEGTAVRAPGSQKGRGAPPAADQFMAGFSEDY